MASFPRSGNTFLRIVLHRLYGVRTSTVYDVDGVARRLGPDLVGFEERPGPIAAMRADDGVHFVKTHRPCDGDVGSDDRAICVVRDGRDALVSWARQRSENGERSFETELRALVGQPDEVGAGSWGRNVLSWMWGSPGSRLVLRYEDLIGDPVRAVGRVMTVVDRARPMVPDASVPSFAELQRVDERFFRRGRSGTHRDEMPADVERLFWSRPDNSGAMNLLGYENRGVRPRPQ